MTDASESIDLDELERFTDRWVENPHNGNTIYSLAWMEGPEAARTEVSAELTVSGLLALIARVREAEAERDGLAAVVEQVREHFEHAQHPAQGPDICGLCRINRTLKAAPTVALDRVKSETRERLAARIDAEWGDTEDIFGYEDYVLGLQRAIDIARDWRDQ